MGLTAYQAKYFAYELTRQQPSNSISKFVASLQDAQVDLNPHQVDAALFAFQSPLSKGAILADEVGLGKTIEAGIILSQNWAERKRRLLIIAPANLRKQWNQELLDKFFLPSVILETKTFNEEIKKGNLNPFDQGENIVICSYQFAKSKAAYVEQTRWDLVVIDEAHRLRNVYKPSNKTANTIKEALFNYKKVLLTATPLQNSILELYGLVSIIDDYVFGDLKSFKSQYSRIADEENYHELRQRIQPVCHRTLRKQVLEYINYTNRSPILQEFFPTDEEHELYLLISEYLQRPTSYALPNSQRQLMTLILRKLLASSSFAIHGTLDTMVNRLEMILENHQAIDFIDVVHEDFESIDEIADEWKDEEEETDEPIYSEKDILDIQEELNELKEYRSLAELIKRNSKAEQLQTALERGFSELNKLGAKKKALIFTESRRTQEFLYKTLEAEGYQGQIVLFNGVNNDPLSREIYKNWLSKHQGTDKVTGSPTADKRAAIVDYFKNKATIMIATEAAAEGINLQFCSLIVNYDMPWNPQRIEQRIGRCHRYGQEHDVVVVNFLNKKNEADIRVYELLDQKFRLFDGVFGASDEVLGAIGSGVDFEKRIAQIYQDCRRPEEIKSAFDQLQEELKPQISERLEQAKSTLLENFDDEVREKLRSHYQEAKDELSRFEEKLWGATQFFLGDSATFTNNYTFSLLENPFPEEFIHAGPYMILKTSETQKKSTMLVPDDTNIYRVGHPLAQRILDACKALETPVRTVAFDYQNTIGRVAYLEQFIGASGWMTVSRLSVQSFETEDYLIASCITDEGENIPSDMVDRILSLEAKEDDMVSLPDHVAHTLQEITFKLRQEIIEENALRNNEFFDVEMDKLDQWADDMKISLEKEIKDIDGEIKLRKAEAKKIMNLEAKVKMQRLIKELESKRSEKRKRLFVAQDEIDERKENLLSEIEERLQQNITETELFTIRWKLV